MGIPADMSTTILSSPKSALPTPAQTPTTGSKKLPTPTADSYDDSFDFKAQSSWSTLPAYTQLELELVIENPPRCATVWYETYYLTGDLYYLPTLFMQLYECFMDISPSESPRPGEAGSEPWTVFHEVMGRTWVDESVLRMLGVGTARVASQQPRFVAFTDNLEVFHQNLSVSILYIGNVTLSGNFSTANTTRMQSKNDLIIALPSDAPFLGLRRATKNCQTPVRSTEVVPYPVASLEMKDLTPGPASPTALATVRKILDAAADPKNMTGTIPKRTWITQKLPEHLKAILTPAKPPPSTASASASSSKSPQSTTKPQTHVCQSIRPAYVLSPTSPLWPHRGNEAVFKRAFWQQMCYTSYQTDFTAHERGGVRIPDAYWQVLFEDLSARERVEGTEELKGVERKWYEVVGQESVEAFERAVKGDGRAVEGEVKQAIVGGGEGVMEAKVRSDDREIEEIIYECEEEVKGGKMEVG